ncbi:TadE family type IV pilus minor pilin [Streptomyces sp. OZ13]|uniref:TadE family type IV pilus minor pilin n=1 Tax=Streptomyces sp. OZ13 TaxID=3452210 RepID=UPI003F8CB196
MTAEAAVAVPALVMFTMGLVWALMAASAQIQCVDAARAGARAAARSEPRAAAVAAARSAAPSGSAVTLTRNGDLWRVRVEADTPGPGALDLTLSAEAVAFAEDSVGQGPNAVAPGAVVVRDTGPQVITGEAARDRTPGDTARNAAQAPASALTGLSGPAPASPVRRHRAGAQKRGEGLVLMRADRGGRGSDTGPARAVGVPRAERPERPGTATAAIAEVAP